VGHPSYRLSALGHAATLIFVVVDLALNAAQPKVADAGTGQGPTLNHYDIAGLGAAHDNSPSSGRQGMLFVSRRLGAALISSTR
jgi:hypothetical protein